MVRKVRARVQWDGEKLELMKVISGGRKQSLEGWDNIAHQGDFNLTRDDFGPPRPGEFEIVYTLKAKGDYVIMRTGGGILKIFKAGDASQAAYDDDRFSFVCFLPRSWDRERVSRDFRRLR